MHIFVTMKLMIQWSSFVSLSLGMQLSILSGPPGAHVCLLQCWQ